MFKTTSGNLMDISKIINIIRRINEEAIVNNVGDGNIAGTVEAGDDPPVRRKKKKPTVRRKKKKPIYLGKGSRRWWLRGLKGSRRWWSRGLNGNG